MQNLRTPSVALRGGRQGGPGTGGPAPHQLARQPASAHSRGNFSFLLLIIVVVTAAQTAHSLLFLSSRLIPPSSEICFSLLAFMKLLILFLFDLHPLVRHCCRQFNTKSITEKTKKMKRGDSVERDASKRQIRERDFLLFCETSEM